MSADERTGVSLIAASSAARASLPELTISWAEEIRKRAVVLANRASTDPKAIADDLEQVGLIAFWRATESFDAGKGFPFEHYVRRILRRAMYSEFRRATSRLSAGRAVWLDDPELDPSFLTLGENPEMEQERADVRRKVRRWVTASRPRLREIFSYLYDQRLTQREAAPLMGLSQPRVTQLHNTLLQHGRDELIALATELELSVARSAMDPR